MLDYIKTHSKIILGIVVTVLILFLGIRYAYTTIAAQEAELQKAKLLTEEQAMDAARVRAQLSISKKNAEMLAEEVKRVSEGKVHYITTFVQPSATVEEAAVEIKDKINANDQTLPSSATAHTDTTHVVPQQVNGDWQVSVYKTNLYKNWELSTGLGVHGSDTYIPIEAQRNFDKNHAVSFEYHLGGNKKGYEVKYTIMTDKPFFGLF